MNNTFLIAYAIFICSMLGLYCTIGYRTVASKIVGFVGGFLSLPIIAGIIWAAVTLDENTGNFWLTCAFLVLGVGVWVTSAGSFIYIQSKLDNRAKKA